MESMAGDNNALRILFELKSLKDSKSLIEHKISVLEAQLHEINLQNEVAKNGSCPSISASKLDPANGLSPDMIYRYSRHLLLPSFGIEGFVLSLLSSIFGYMSVLLFCSARTLFMCSYNLHQMKFYQVQKNKP